MNKLLTLIKVGCRLSPPLQYFITSIILATLLLALGSHLALAQNDEVKPGDNLLAEGIPKIPLSLATTVKHYTSASGYPLADWERSQRALLLKVISSRSTWLYRVETPGSKPTPVMYIPAGDVYDLYFQPQGKFILYNKDTAGNESFQLFLYNIATRNSTPLTDAKSRNVEPVWSNAGDRIIYGSTPHSGNGVSLYVINPLDPSSNRLLVQSQGNYLKMFDWSPDDRKAIFHESISSSYSLLWMIDVTTGEKTLLSAGNGNEKAVYDFAQFSKDGKGIFIITDHNSEFRRLAYLDLSTKHYKYLTDHIKWDVDEFQIAPDGKTLAFTTNEDGISRLHLLDTSISQEKKAPVLPIGVISDLKWHANAQDLAFNFKSARTPNDVYALNLSSGKIEQWSKSVTGDIAAEKLSEPQLIRWKSFDGRMISGFLYRPPTTFTGKRPVMIDIHGGPELQFRPEFLGASNYFINELGIVKIYPNVRGSTGYGKTFLNLDNGMRREDAVKDIGALLDWIKAQPDLDADRVMVQGASYGGYLALSVAVSYSDRIRAALSDSGPSALASFIENTEGWRRDLRRGEYGDEREPKMRDFLERTSPLKNIKKIKTPLMIIQGKNDPRVRASEAEAMVHAARKNGIPVWYLLAQDEGHDFIKQSNINFAIYSTMLFVKEFLLK